MSKWISVKEKLPHDKQKVVFKGSFPFTCQGFFEKTEKGYSFFNLSGKKIYHIYGVTHWKELDEPARNRDVENTPGKHENIANSPAKKIEGDV